MTAKSDQEIVLPSYFQEDWEAWRDYCSDGTDSFSGRFEDCKRPPVPVME
jgi:hypothetical protein